MLQMDRQSRVPAAIALGYAVFGTLWITTSDYLLLRLDPDSTLLAQGQAAKGIAFIVITAAALYGLLRALYNQVARLHDAYRELLGGPARYYWLTNRNGDVIEQVNDGFLELTGQDPTDLTQESWAKLIHPADRDQFFATRYSALEAGQPYESGYRLKARDGRYRFMHVREAPIRGARGNILQWIGAASDITELKHVQQQLEQERQHFRLAEKVSGVSLWHWDFKQQAIQFSSGVEEQLGYQPGELGDDPTTFADLAHPDDRKRMRGEIEGVSSGAEAQSGVYRLCHKDGSYRWILSRVQQVSDDDGRVIGLVGANIDITDRKHHEEQMAYQRHHDKTTGLYNIDYMQAELARATKYAQKRGQRLGLLLINVDQFHVLNQSLGRSAGDRLLKDIGERIQQRRPPSSVLCRYIGDGFALIIDGNPDTRSLSAIADAISQTCQRPFAVNSRPVYINVTIGGSLFPTPAPDAEKLVNQAETALQRGKRRGRNCYQPYSHKVESEEQHWAQHANALRHGLANDEFDVVFQPQFDIKNGRFCGFEALARWHSATLGDVTPDVFIPIAEGCGQIGTLSNLIITKAVTEQAHWHARGHADLRLAVNLSARQLYAPEFVAALLTIVGDAHIPPEMVDLEVTEAAVQSDPELGNAVLRQLARHGFAIVIDNFGTTRSSIATLGPLKADAVKIDKHFIQGLHVDDYCAAAAKAIIGLAHSLDIAVIAEGVETASQVGFVHQHGVERLQGYYFSRPLPADGVLPFMDKAASNFQT